MIYDELARSPFIANGGPLLILLIIVVWFLAKEPVQKLWEWLKRRSFLHILTQFYHKNRKN